MTGTVLVIGHFKNKRTGNVQKIKNKPFVKNDHIDIRNKIIT